MLYLRLPRNTENSLAKKPFFSSGFSSGLSSAFSSLASTSASGASAGASFSLASFSLASLIAPTSSVLSAPAVSKPSSEALSLLAGMKAAPSFCSLMRPFSIRASVLSKGGAKSSFSRSIAVRPSYDAIISISSNVYFSFLDDLTFIKQDTAENFLPLAAFVLYFVLANSSASKAR